MFSIATLDRELQHLTEWRALFDSYRLVEVGTHCVYDYHDGVLYPQSEPCYAVWNRDHACNNCSSLAACHTNKQVVKLECLEDAVFIIFSEPVTLAGKHMVLELIRDVTQTMLVNDGQHAGNIAVKELVAQLNDLIIHDSLTGVYNRRYANQVLSDLQQEYGTNFSSFFLTMVDVDHLKLINDTFGHQTGDDALVTVSRTLSGNLPDDNCWVCRLGGDEFLVAIYDRTEAEVEAYIRTVTDAIEANKLPHTARSLSISTGTAAYTAGSTADALMETADQRMYEMKRRRQQAE